MTAALEIRGASKTFGSRQVLRDVELRLEPGEIHGLLGQNGSGKSTLIKILAGYHAPDPGAVLSVGGREVGLPLAPDQPRRLGIAFVHQDLGLVEDASVMENLRLGEFATRRWGRISWSAERQRTRQALAGFGLDVDPDALAGELTQVERAMLAILRALEALRGHQQGVLVLDEPTAYLPRDSAARLFDAVRQRIAEGIAVLLVSHRLDEIRAVCDRVTILRDGARIRLAATDSMTEAEMVREILGFELDRLYPEPHRAGGETVLKVEGIESETVAALDLSVRAGEVVGLTGLMGMGY
ncbi:MAG TPA: ATP-binding cassette domain-containing protein, partial [Solirubrobacterales bacterium]|nr:ATP-binding cassette domain-containing protein [Solirubrobacterales bacterium]